MERQKIRRLVKSLPLLGPLLVGGLLAVGSAEAQGIRYIIPPDINVCTTCHPYDAPLSAGTTVVFSDGHQEIFPDGLNLPTRAWLNEHDPQAAKQVYTAAGLTPPEGQFSSQYYPHTDQPAEWPSANQFVNESPRPKRPWFLVFFEPKARSFTYMISSRLTLEQ